MSVAGVLGSTLTLTLAPMTRGYLHLAPVPLRGLASRALLVRVRVRVRVRLRLRLRLRVRVRVRVRVRFRVRV